MRTATRWMIAAVVTACVAVGQEPSSSPKVLSVCDVLGDLTHLAGAAVVVVGREEQSAGVIDRQTYLSQDHCEHPVLTNGHVWPNKIQIWARWEPGMPNPPRERPRLAPGVVTAKLATIRKTTKLHPKSTDGWAAVYGRIVKLPKLQDDCGAGGCGGDDVPLMIIAEPCNLHQLREDGSRLPER